MCHCQEPKSLALICLVYMTFIFASLDGWTPVVIVLMQFVHHLQIRKGSKSETALPLTSAK